MATVSKRHRVNGGLSWDATVRVRGYPTQCKSFRTRLEAEHWAARTESAAHARTLVLGAQLRFSDLLDAATPRLRRPVDTALRYWRTHLGTLRLRDITPTLVARHRDLLLGAPTRAHGHKKSKPRPGSTVRSDLACLSAVFKVGLRELHWCDSKPVRDVAQPRASAERRRSLPSCPRSRSSTPPGTTLANASFQST